MKINQYHRFLKEISDQEFEGDIRKFQIEIIKWRMDKDTFG